MLRLYWRGGINSTPVDTILLVRRASFIFAAPLSIEGEFIHPQKIALPLKLVSPPPPLSPLIPPQKYLPFPAIRPLPVSEHPPHHSHSKAPCSYTPHPRSQM